MERPRRNPAEGGFHHQRNVKLSLTNAEAAFLNHHKGRKLEAKIHLTFSPKKGAKLKTTTTAQISAKQGRGRDLFIFTADPRHPPG
jgi:hypothetical protein